MQAPPAAPLPFVDRHVRRVAAPPEVVWEALAAFLPGAFDGAFSRAYARAIGCEAAANGGAFPAEGARIVGFVVAESEPPRALVLAGRHRFSAYLLTFRIAPAEGGASRISAETRALFPGPAGAVYRLAVIGSGGHHLAVRGLLRGIARRAEGAARAGG